MTCYQAKYYQLKSAAEDQKECFCSSIHMYCRITNISARRTCMIHVNHDPAIVAITSIQPYIGYSIRTVYSSKTCEKNHASIIRLPQTPCVIKVTMHTYIIAGFSHKHMHFSTLICRIYDKKHAAIRSTVLM